MTPHKHAFKLFGTRYIYGNLTYTFQCEGCSGVYFTTHKWFWDGDS